MIRVLSSCANIPVAQDAWFTSFLRWHAKDPRGLYHSAVCETARVDADGSRRRRGRVGETGSVDAAAATRSTRGERPVNAAAAAWIVPGEAPSTFRQRMRSGLRSREQLFWKDY
mmetsp:Transcript_14973/g.46494  ORF Transcript_14973/g.46494 Transcript_14973/m.46494 type:complete len:114 (-) Transcript_14973:96-437(-)